MIKMHQYDYSTLSFENKTLELDNFMIIEYIDTDTDTDRINIMYELKVEMLTSVTRIFEFSFYFLISSLANPIQHGFGRTCLL